ncbi:MAG: peptidoglycan-binding protein [Proteobacteria bacterium]|nr:peptidoglycan-binding protein [Pseudomonadota bacterium]
MIYPELRRGAKGEKVILLQTLLNRAGAMLNADGDFGLATEKGICYAQDVANQPVTGIVNRSLWTWLESRPEPSSLLPTNGLAFIALEETGGLTYYETNTRWPHFPGEASGITIGVGYDLKWNSEQNFRSTWSDYLLQDTIDELAKDIGKRGTKKRVNELRQRGIEVPFKSAWPVFAEKTLPRFYRETESIYPSLGHLPELCRSVLVSIVFNRGASLTGDRRKEMKNIQSILSRASQEEGSKDEQKMILADVEDQIISMKRLWNSGSGLIKRRQSEANLWRKGLALW